jgi:hypothetical protein
LLRRNPPGQPIQPSHAQQFAMFPNAAAFRAYRLVFPTTRLPTAELQVGEVQLQGWQGMERAPLALGDGTLWGRCGIFGM